MVAPIRFPCRQPACQRQSQLSQSMQLYRNSIAFVSSTYTALRVSNFVPCLCNSQPPSVKCGKPRIDARQVIFSALNPPRRKSKFNAKKQQEIKHADAEVVSDSRSIGLDGDGSEDGAEDGDEDEDFSQFVQLVDLSEHGDYEDDNEDTVVAISDEDDDGTEGDFSNQSGIFIRQDDNGVIYLDGNDFEKRESIQTSISNLSISSEDDFGDDESDDEDHDDGVRAYDDNGMTVIDIQAPSKRKEERARTRSLLGAITTQPKPGTTFAADAESQPPIELDESIEYVETVVRAADTRKAEDIRVLRVSKLTHITSFIIIVTGNSAPQIRAIANLVEENLSKIHSLEPQRIDGVPNSGWILLDYGDFLVNVFSPEQRRNYNLEALWSRAEQMGLSNLILRGQEEPQASGQGESLDDWLSEN